MESVNKPIEVLIVDDDALVRGGLSLILGGYRAITVIGEAVDGNDAIAQVMRSAPDVVLMDIRMPNLGGLAATTELLKRPNPPKVIVLTTFDADEYVLRALAEGANGFLLKDTPPAQLVEAIKRVVDGESILSPSVTTQLVRQVTARSDDGRARIAREKIATLTRREREVAAAVARGQSNAEIAASLYMSLPTVKAHVSHIFTKLGAVNRVQIAIHARNADLV